MESGVFDRFEELSRIELLNTFYAADWADGPSRRVALLALGRAAEPGFRWRLASRFPPVELPLELAGLIGDAIERDFARYLLRPSDVAAAPPRRSRAPWSCSAG